MLEAILHIGLPKTGSTYLQHWLSLNRAALRAIGLVAPEKPGFGHRIREEYETYFSKGVALPTNAIDIEGAFAAGPQDIAIISSEGFFKCDAGEVKRYFDLKEIRIVKIVLFLRRQDRHEASVFNQRVKVAGHADTYRVGSFGTDYMRLWQSWADSFGAETMVVLDYDHCRKGRKIEEVFLTRLGYPLLSDPVLPDGVIATNPSPDAALLEIMRLSNLRGHASMVTPLKQHAIGKLPPAPPFAIDPARSAEVEKLYLHSNRQLAGTIGAEGLESLITPGWRSDGADFTGKDVTEHLFRLIAVLAEASARLPLVPLDENPARPDTDRAVAASGQDARRRADEIAALSRGDGAALRLLFERAAGAGVFEPDPSRPDATPAARSGPEAVHTSFNELIDVAAYAARLINEARPRAQGAETLAGRTTPSQAMQQTLKKSWLLRPHLAIRRAYARTRLP
ncbi:MAG: hypothetical protein AB7S46_04925 [Flavobacteriaceae bacterium]